MKKNALKRERKAANGRVLKKNVLKRERKTANERVLAENALKRVAKRGNGHKIEENVTKCSGKALEYEKALPRKGKVFQMKCLTQPNRKQYRNFILK